MKQPVLNKVSFSLRVGILKCILNGATIYTWDKTAVMWLLMVNFSNNILGNDQWELKLLETQLKASNSFYNDFIICSRKNLRKN